MKIVDRATFMALPAGTVYQKYEPCVFGPISIKGETCGTDFYEVCGIDQPDFDGSEGSEDHFDIIQAIERGEPSPALRFHTICRDGLFDMGQLFAVWEPDDVRGLIARFEEALRTSAASPPESSVTQAFHAGDPFAITFLPNAS